MLTLVQLRGSKETDDWVDVVSYEVFKKVRMKYIVGSWSKLDPWVDATSQDS